MPGSVGATTAAKAAKSAVINSAVQVHLLTTNSS
jgi:hypothetical protein